MLQEQLKLNVEQTGIGSLTREIIRGFILSAFSKWLIGRFSPFIFECLAIRDGLLFVKDSSLRISIVESDSVNAVIEDFYDCSAEFFILNDIKILL